MRDWWRNRRNFKKSKSRLELETVIIEAYCRIMDLPEPILPQSDSDTWCHLCEKHYRYLKAHMRIHETKPYQCEVCKRNFAEVSQLKEHMRIRHIEEKPFACSNCGKGFPTKQRLKQHMKIHEAVKQFKCEVCARRFTFKSHLKRHMYTHTGERPHKCNELGCNAAFSQLIQLKNHKAKHHKIS